MSTSRAFLCGVVLHSGKNNISIVQQNLRNIERKKGILRNRVLIIFLRTR